MKFHSTIGDNGFHQDKYTDFFQQALKEQFRGLLAHFLSMCRKSYRISVIVCALIGLMSLCGSLKERKKKILVFGLLLMMM